MDCSCARPYLQAYVDHELSPERSIELEQHLLGCQPCSDEVALTRELLSATRLSVSEIKMCPEFHARLCRCVSDERRRQQKVSDPLSWKVITPLAAAVAMALFFAYGEKAVERSTEMAAEESSSWGQVATASSATGGQENLVDFLVNTHARRFSPEVVEAEQVDVLEPELGFAVHPPDLGKYGARFEGAHLVPVNHRARAAVLRYNIAGRRVTLYMYNPEEMPLIRQRNLQPRVIGDRAVFVGTSRGYSIATCERHGVGYAVTADLSDDESAELVAALDR